MASVGVGVIGAGVMGAEHARILSSEIAGARLVAVADADLTRAQAVAGPAKALSDPRALILDPAVEAVVVATPDDTHCDLVLAAIESGKPVLCEKPLAASTAECLEVVQAEMRCGRPLVQVGFMRRFDPAYREMKASLDTHALGAVRILHCRHRNPSAPAWFTDAMAVTNALVHELDLGRWLLSTEYRAVTVFGAGGDEAAHDPALFVLETDAGSLVSVEVFINAGYGYHIGAEAVCANGTVGLSHPGLIRTRRDLGETASYPNNWIPRFRDAYRLQNQAWIAGLTTGSGPSDGSTAWDGLVATALAEQIVDALRTGRRTPLRLPERPMTACL